LSLPGITRHAGRYQGRDARWCKAA